MQTEAKVWETRNNGEGGKEKMTYLDIEEEFMTNTSIHKIGIEKSKEYLSDDDRNAKDMVFDNVLSSEDGNIEFNENTGTISFSKDVYAEVNGKKEKVLYFSDDIQLDLDIVVEIVQYYMKKLGKLKTVLEATK